MLLKIITVIFVLSIPHCHGIQPLVPPKVPNAVPQTPASPPANQNPKCNKTSTNDSKGFGLQFRSPFTDMEIKNQHNVRIIQEATKHQVFVLHGNELYRMFVSRQESKLSLICVLTGNVAEEEHLGAQILSWRSYLLVAVAVEEYLEIYQIPYDDTAEAINSSKNNQTNKDNAPHIEPIQQLTLPGKFKQVFLNELVGEQVMLLVAVHFTKSSGKFRTYEWSNTYFELAEDLTVPPLHYLNVIGSKSKFFISGRAIKHQSKTILTVHEMDVPKMKLVKRQTLTVASLTVHTFTFRGKNFIIACMPKQKKCSSFLMKDDGQFAVYKHRSSEELAFEKFVAGKHFLVGSRRNEVVVYKNAHFNCYGSFTSEEKDVVSMFVHVNEHDEDFVLLSYKRPSSILMRMVEVEAESGVVLGAAADNDTDIEDLDPRRQHQHVFEDTIGQLRSMLLQRKTFMDVFRQVANLLTPKFTELKVKNPVTVHAGNIGIINIVDESLRSPLQLLERIDEMGKKFGRSRSPRSTQPLNSLGIPTKLKVKNLKVGNLLYNGTVLEGFHLNTSTKSAPILSIRPHVQTKILETQQLITDAQSRQPRGDDWKETSSLRTQQLFVEAINNVPWVEFYDMLFLRNRDTKIAGRLIFQAETRVVNLWVDRVNKLAVKQLFNLKEPQVISSNVLFKGFLIQNMTAEKVNGIDFAKDVVFSGRDDFIETPINIHQLSIKGDLILDNSTKSARVAEPLDVGLQQFYTGKVIINGSLTVNNLMRDNLEESVVLVDNLPLSEKELKENYLLRNEPQMFEKPITFGNAKVTVPSFNTNYLNNHPVDQHLLNTFPLAVEKPLKLIFFNATIIGDHRCTNSKSKIAEMGENVVRHGDVANITGFKTFIAPLEVDHLMTLQLDELPVRELVLKSQLKDDFSFNGTKSFEKVEVSNTANVSENLNTRLLNNLPLHELLTHEYRMEHLYVPFTLRASNLVFHKINGIPVDGVFANLNPQNGQLILHKNIIVDGCVHFSENLLVKSINAVEWDDYLESLVRLNENASIEGEKQFLGELTVARELETPRINNISMDEVFENILSKSKAQLITGKFSFDNLRLSNLDVSSINGVPTSNLIDTRSDNIVIESDVIVPKLTVQGNVKGDCTNQFQFSKLPERLQRLIDRPWRNLVVLGNAHYNFTNAIDRSQHEQLEYLHKNAVRRSGNQVITGNVKLQRPIITKMITQTSFPEDINLDFIIKDCLLKNTSAPQTIYGAKTFRMPLHMQKVQAESDFTTNLMNRIDVLRFNDSLYRLSSTEPIIGPLYFRTAPIMGIIRVEGLVNGINSTQIYHSPSTLLPPLKMRSLAVDGDLQIQDINDRNLNDLLKNRITKSGKPLEIAGFLTFENLVLNKSALLQSINDISIDNLVFKKYPHLQAITGPKVIDGNLILLGPAHVLRLNDQDLISNLQQTIFTSGNYNFDNLIVDEATFAKGLVVVSDINAAIGRGRANVEVPENEVEHENDVAKIAVAEQLQKVNTFRERPAEKEEPHNLVYLDYDFGTEVVWQLPNETVDMVGLYEIERLSMCDYRMLQIQKSQTNRRLYLANVTRSFLTTSLGHLRVKAHNFCKTTYRKVKSKITVTGEKISKVFGMKKFIENMEIYHSHENNSYLLLHALDPTQKSSEVRILQVDDGRDTISDWQSITRGIGNVTKLFKFSNYTALVSAGVANNLPAVNVYEFHSATQKFQLSQVIEGDFDLIEMVDCQRGKYQLILSCRHCQNINVYEKSAESDSLFQIFQILKLKARISKIFPHALGDGALYLLALSEREHNFYHLYKYTHVQGWRHITYGYFHNIQLALPLNGKAVAKVGDNLLLLLCDHGSVKCNLVRGIVQ